MSSISSNIKFLQSISTLDSLSERQVALSEEGQLSLEKATSSFVNTLSSFFRSSESVQTEKIIISQAVLDTIVQEESTLKSKDMGINFETVSKRLFEMREQQKQDATPETKEKVTKIFASAIAKIEEIKRSRGPSLLSSICSFLEDSFSFSEIETSPEKKAIPEKEVIENPKPASDLAKAIAKFQGNDYLSNSDLIEYAKYLRKIGSFTLVTGLMFVTVPMEKGEPPEQFVARIILDALKKSKNKELIFIPIILQSNLKNAPLIGKIPLITSDHIVILTVDPVKKKCEYYDSQGESLEKETRKIPVFNQPANAVFKNLIKLIGFNQEDDFEILEGIPSNPTEHQKDHIHCGAFVCRFMRERLARTFGSICKEREVDILSERKTMASQLKSQRDS